MIYLSFLFLISARGVMVFCLTGSILHTCHFFWEGSQIGSTHQRYLVLHSTLLGCIKGHCPNNNLSPYIWFNRSVNLRFLPLFIWIVVPSFSQLLFLDCWCRLRPRCWSSWLSLCITKTSALLLILLPQMASCFSGKSVNWLWLMVQGSCPF